MSLELDDETLEALGWGGDRATESLAARLDEAVAPHRAYMRAYMAEYRRASPLAQEHRARERRTDAAKARRAAWERTPKGRAYLARKRARRARRLEATP